MKGGLGESCRSSIYSAQSSNSVTQVFGGQDMVISTVREKA